MRSKIKLYILILGGDLFILLFSFLSFYNTIYKPDLPFKFHSLDTCLIVKENQLHRSIISIGDTLISINERKLTSQDEVEVFLDGYKPGSFVQINYLKNGNIFSTPVKLIKFYSIFYIITAYLAGFLLIVIGTFVILKKPDNKPARLLFWVNLITASIIMMTWGNYNNPPTIVDYVIHAIFSISYSLAPAIFVHFTLSFPREKNVPKVFIGFLYSSALIISILTSIFFIKAISSATADAIKEYLIIFNYSRIYMAACIISGLIIFIHSYITSQNLSEKKKLRWILLGFILGPLMYACLWVIPQEITNYGLVPEELVIIFMLFIPATFAIAILKYHIFDIDLIIERSLIYFLSIGILIIVYAVIVALLSEFVKNINEFLSSGIAAVIIALLFTPAKEKVQKFINKKFFRVRYDFRIASRKFLDEIKNSSEINILAEKIVKQIKVIIPVKRQGFFLLSKTNSRIYLQAGENFDILKGRGIFIDQQKLKTNLSQPVAIKDKIEPGSPIEEADIEVFKRWGMALIFPIKSNSDELLGFLVLGGKKSGSRFTIEDLDLLIEVCLQAGLTIERIQIQEKLIREQLLKEKLQELNQLKSFFLSSVSHELKTPLTSIRMFAEFLHINTNLEPDKKEEYLEIIEGECDRLSRLIENVLDLSKIERGVKEFHLTDIDIKSLLKHTIALMSYQTKIEDCQVITKICKEECVLNGDVDLIQSAIINLLSNGIKYSSSPKKVFVDLEKNEKSININFENDSTCLSQDELLKLTKPYYRSESAKKQKIPGSGIGLTLVNQIMTIHKGQLLIKNIPDNGCVFTLSFPREKCYEKNINS